MPKRKRNVSDMLAYSTIKGGKAMVKAVLACQGEEVFESPFLSELISFHENKHKVTDVKCFLYAQQDGDFYRNERVLQLVYNDPNREPDNISINKCIRWSLGHDSAGPMEAVKKAARLAVGYSAAMTTFRHSEKENDGRCAICGVTEGGQIDHKEPSFQSMFEEFGRFASSIEVEQAGKSNFLSFNDKQLEADWIRYHDSRATFQWLCTPCNIRKC